MKRENGRNYGLNCGAGLGQVKAPQHKSLRGFYFYGRGDWI